MKKLVITLLIVFVLILAACSKPPTDEMNRAIDAVTLAENDADAVTYAGNTLIRARDSLTRMQSEADSKRYDEAKNFAAEAESLAERAITEGKTGAERAKAEAENLVNSLQGPLAETSNALNAARQVENIQLDFSTLEAEMETARRAYDEAGQSLGANNYQDAITKGENARSILSGINLIISDAAQATSRKQ